MDAQLSSCQVFFLLLAFLHLLFKSLVCRKNGILTFTPHCTVLFEGQEGNQDGIQALRNRIMEVSRQEPYMGEKIPVR